MSYKENLEIYPQIDIEQYTQVLKNECGAKEHPLKAGSLLIGYDLIIRYVTGDWGDLDDEDKAENDVSVEKGFRILSAYKLETDVKVWVITEWDRSVTTLLLPEEY